MRFHIWIKTIVVSVLFIQSAPTFAAMYTKTPSAPPTATVMSSGTPNMAANILEVGINGVEYIAAGESESRAVANVTKGVRVPTSGIVTGLKGVLRGGIAGIAVNGAIAAVIGGVGWIQGEGGQIQKPGQDPTPVPTTGTSYYRYYAQGKYYSSAQEACVAIAPVQGFNFIAVKEVAEDSFACYGKSQPQYGGNEGNYYTMSRMGSGCPTGSVYSSGACLSTASSPQSLTESDYDVLDGFVKGKDGVWQQGLANDVCKSSANFEGCIANMGATPYISGPTTVSSPETTTETQTQNPDGTSTQVTTKKKTDYTLGYPNTNPATISVDPKTTTTTTTTEKDKTGQIVSTNTTTSTQTQTQPGTGTQLADGTFTDTPFPDVEPFYQQKYPDGFKGVWSKNKDAFMQSDFITFLKGFVPTFSGSCPTFGLSFDIMAHANFGYISFWSMCWIFDVIKTIMLVTAMFTCRALIFGG